MFWPHDQGFDFPGWPATGMALGTLLVLGSRFWPALFAGAWVVSLVFLLRQGAQPGVVLFAAPALALGETFQALAGAWLTRKFARGREAFSHPASVVRFILFSACLSAALGTTAALGVFRLAGLVRTESVVSQWLTWWLADMVSLVIVTPLVAAESPSARSRLSARRVGEGALLLAALVFASGFAFGEWGFTRPRGSSLTVVLVPLILWSALRFGLRGSAAACFIIAWLSIQETLNGHGPFASAAPGFSPWLLQTYIAVISAMSLALAADVRQRQRMGAGLRDSEQRYRELFEANPQPMWVHDAQTLAILAVNEAAVRHYGYSREEFLRLTVMDLQPADLHADPLPGPAAPGSLPRQGVHRKKDGSLIDVEIVRRRLAFDGRPALIESCSDISQRNRSARQAATFSELGRRLSAASTPREAAQLIAAAADSLFGWDACFLDLRGPDPGRVDTIFATDTVQGRRVEMGLARSRLGPLTQQTLEKGPQLISRADDPGPFAPEEQPFGDVRRRSRSLMFVPVRHDDRAVGVFSIHSYTPNAYQPADLQLLQALADHCGAALERIRAEEEVQRLNRELRHRLEELQTLFQAAPVGIAVARDPECCRVTGNPACAAILGVQFTGGACDVGQQLAPEIPGLKFTRAGEELSAAELPMRRAARQGLPVPAEELEARLPDGRRVSVYASASPLYDELGRVRGSLGVFVDLTERKKVDAALRERDERLRLALTASRMGAWTLELLAPPTLFSSPELEMIFGFPAREFTGSLETFFKRVHLSDRDMVRQAIDHALRQVGDYEIEFRFLPRHRPMGWLLVRGRAYPAEGGRPKRLAGVGIDITARKEAQEEVLRLNAELERRVQERTAQLEAINQELEAFSYSVSHDLRAPLRSIRGFSEVLLQHYAPNLDSRGRDFLRRSCESSAQMDKLIDDLLELSRVGRAELRSQPVDLGKLARNIVEELRAAEPERRVEFVSVPEARTRGDERLLRLVLENLLRNAWKFTARTPAARIEFGLTPPPQAAFFVRDNGAGFDMAYADRLFRVFQRLHSGAEFPGTGVGLATVQRIINRHRGRVWAQGAPGRGADFFFTLPA